MYNWIIPPIFVAIGFFLNSSLHAYYVTNGRKTKIKYSYQIPDLIYDYTSLDDWLDLTDHDWSKYILKWDDDNLFRGIKRAGLNGIVVGLLVSVFDFLFIRSKSFSRQEVFQTIVLFVILSFVIILVSQRLGGGSVTKLVLDILLLILGSLLVVIAEFDVPVTFWRVYSVYLSIAFGLITIGIEWRNYVDRRGYDQIPSLIYYLSSMTYTVTVSLFFIIVIELLLISP